MLLLLALNNTLLFQLLLFPNTAAWMSANENLETMWVLRIKLKKNCWYCWWFCGAGAGDLMIFDLIWWRWWWWWWLSAEEKRETTQFDFGCVRCIWELDFEVFDGTKKTENLEKCKNTNTEKEENTSTTAPAHQQHTPAMTHQMTA